MDYAEIILSVLFCALAIHQFVGIYRTYQYITYFEMRWTVSRILFIICGVFALFSMFFVTHMASRIRLFFMMLCVIVFIYSRDGIGEDGIGASGKWYPWDRVKSYDYLSKGKKFYVHFVVKKEKADRDVTIPFEQKREKEITAFLKEKVGKKHMRRKKQ